MRRRALLQTTGTVAAALLAGCGSILRDDQSSTGSPEQPTATTTAPGVGTPLALDGHELVRTNVGSSNELVKVTGTLVNQGNSVVENATVSATFFDDEGAELDRSSADVTDLAPDETWSFELTYPGVGENARTVADYTLAVEIGD